MAAAATPIRVKIFRQTVPIARFRICAKSSTSATSMGTSGRVRRPLLLTHDPAIAVPEGLVRGSKLVDGPSVSAPAGGGSRGAQAARLAMPARGVHR
jgi:hypothetical protein